MKRVIAIADRHAATALKLCAAVNLLLFLSFLAVLFLALQQARAETPACAGHNLLPELQASQPQAYAKAEAEAAATRNGKGLLWKLEKDGKPTSYLFGTMHMTDQRVTSLTPAAQKAFDGAHTVVIETTDVLDKAKMMAAMAEHPELMMYTDDQTLVSGLSDADREALEKGLAARGIPLGSVIKMKPWVLASMVALPACETARQAEGAPVLDVKLAKDAEAQGKALVGLESMADQLGAMASLPMDLHMRGLIDTLKLGDKIEDVMETMIDLYEQEDTALIMPLVNAITEEAGADTSGYAEFEETMVKARNVTMAERASRVLEGGGVFMAVGALHLPGPGGLIELFRKAGYTVTPGG